MEPFYPIVLQAVPGNNYTVYVYLNDGTVRLLDVAPLINKGGVFLPLKDAALFQSALAVINDTVAWDLSGTRDPANCIDIDPFLLLEMPIAQDILETVV